jgi:alkanesulfonate monooxygenase SsuD/methylene tetrahydromethanopterin reductase-like flavin-dependent oxidoreductase (luciferase family)
MKEMMGIYREAWKEAGHPGKGKIMLMFHMFCWPDETEAHDLAREHINDYIASFAEAASDWVTGTASDAYPGYDKLVANLANDNFENTLARGAAWVGTPKTIIEQIKAFQNDIGDIEIGSFQVNFSEMPVELAENSLENFSRGVMPHFKD